MFPTIWMDTEYYQDTGITKINFWIAWQYDSTDSHRDPFLTHYYRDIYVSQYYLEYGKLHEIPSIVYVTGPTRVSALVQPLNQEWQAQHPCISGCRISHDTTVVQVAYESEEGNEPGYPNAKQGIAIAKWRTFKSWVRSVYEPTSDTVNDLYWYPQIEVSRYHMDSTFHLAFPYDNFYTYAHERMNGNWIMNWAMDSSAWRLAGHPLYINTYDFTSMRHPQLSVVGPSVDHYIGEMGMLLSGLGFPIQKVTGGAYKMGTNDSLWEYRSVGEEDSSGKLRVGYELGEFATDDGSTVLPIDFAYCSDSVQIDSNHPAASVMRSKHFTLPASGAFSYFCWLRSNNDSLFRVYVANAKYALDFFDTSGNFVCRLDSVMLTDSVPHRSDTTRTITLDREANQLGYVEFGRVSTGLRTDSTRWQEIISTSRLSTASSSKQSSMPAVADSISIAAMPNPLRGQTEIRFAIPREGDVQLDVLNVLGEVVSSLGQRSYHAGEHHLVWNATNLHSGVYLVRMRYGNSLRNVRVVLLK
jgi:hypothetical protein